MQFVLSIAIVQVLVAMYLLLTSQSKHKSKSYIYALIAIATVHFTVKFLMLAVLKDEFLFENMITGFSYVYFLLLYLYTKEFLHDGKSKETKQIYHIIGFSIAVAAYASVAVYTAFNYDKHVLILYKKIVSVLVSILLWGYLLATFVILQKAKKQIQDRYKAFKSLHFIIYALIFSFLLSFLILPFRTDENNYSYISRIIFYSSIVTSIIFMVQHHYKNAYIFSKKSDEKEKPKYEKYRLKNDVMEELAQKLESLMIKNQLYLKADLTLEELAKELAVPKHHLTQSLNEYFNKNFYQFINAYRVQEVQERMKKDHKTNVLEIAFECGFNTKSSFNSYFKTITGYTPTQYRQFFLNTSPKNND